MITLGIIGVVAAMTLPVLIQKNNNRVVETRLKKFYSSINQAILMAEKDYGDKKDWYDISLSGSEIDSDGNIVAGTSNQEKWFNKYLAPYMKVVKTKSLRDDGRFIVYFADGSALSSSRGDHMQDLIFYPGDPDRCLKKYSRFGALGKCAFMFFYSPNCNSYNCAYHYNKGPEPYKYAWDGNIKSLYKGLYSCGNSNSHYCTAIIQLNGWKIPDDYPYKVSY
ncbi:TPA: hypothetical protein IAC10_09865 [Candidatus Scatousia excrementigallinarum]|uniref:DUF6613 domain-containing protein n=1 Tax=Candidatus Scatousia excrementigallinarum TaxID=2840935 RepID=A0A9D1F0F7_9BACT|nr:hypothetical protein [Candidatus Scatousia excrementigallinarum]